MIDANNPGDILETFRVSKSPVLCIASVSGEQKYKNCSRHSYIDYLYRSVPLLRVNWGPPISLAIYAGRALTS